MKYVKLFEEFIESSDFESKSFEYKGYFCRIVKRRSRKEDGWNLSIYKGLGNLDQNNYIMGIKGLIPLKDAIKMAKEYVDGLDEAAAFYIDSTEVPIRLGNKIELVNGQHGVVLNITGNHEAMILLDNGLTTRINPQTDVKQLISDTEPTKGNKSFMD
jgi:hypothetical protein